MRNGGIQLRISDLLFAVQKRWKIIVALTFIGGVFGMLLSGMTYVQSSLATYDISGSMAINTRFDDGTYLYGDDAPSQNDYHLAEDMVDAVIYMVRSVRVLNDVINEQGLLGVSYLDIRAGMNVSAYNNTQILEMTIKWRNDEEGMAIWHNIIDRANELMPQTLTIGHLDVINDCVARLEAAGGTSKTIPVFLALLGLAAGIGFAVMEVLMHPTLTNVKDMETLFGLETIGLIPRDEEFFRKKGSILVQDDIGSSVVAQNYSAAAYILRNRLGTKEDHHCFYVTSATNREGRSTVAANLAIQLSDMEHRTLLVDFDFKNPTLGALFMGNVDYEHSLNALYRGEITEQEAVTTLTGYLDILPTVLEHNTVPMDGVVMDLIKKLSEKYEYVILDAPPVGKESDTLSLNQIANTVLYVVGYDSATIPEIQSSLEKLDKSGIRVLGCVINNVQGTRYHGLGDKEEVRKRIQKAKKKKEKAEERFAGAEQAADENLPLIKTDSRKDKKKKQKEDKKAARKAKRLEELDGEEENTAVTPAAEENAARAEEAPTPDAEEKSTGMKQEDRAEETAKEETPSPAPAAPRARRNVFEDIESDAAREEQASDQDMLDQLFRFGIEGKAEPAAPEKNPLDDTLLPADAVPADAVPLNAVPVELVSDKPEPAAAEPALPEPDEDYDEDEEDDDRRPARRRRAPERRSADRRSADRRARPHRPRLPRR